jgi:hypothetical protein
MLEQPHFTFADLVIAGFPREHFFRGYLGAPAVITVEPLKQIPLQEILLLEEILG